MRQTFGSRRSQHVLPNLSFGSVTPLQPNTKSTAPPVMVLQPHVFQPAVPNKVGLKETLSPWPATTRAKPWVEPQKAGAERVQQPSLLGQIGDGAAPEPTHAGWTGSDWQEYLP